MNIAVNAVPISLNPVINIKVILQVINNTKLVDRL